MRFYITYNEENVGLNTMVLFTFEQDTKNPAKTYIDFKLNVNRYKNEQGGHIEVENNIQALQKVRATSPIKKKIVIEADKRRLYINSPLDLDKYQRILFAQSEYFSFIDVYIGSCFLGTCFRLQNYQLSDFYCNEDTTKIDLRMTCDKIKMETTNNLQGQILAQSCNLPVGQFRSKQNNLLLNSYIGVIQRIQNLLAIYDEQLIYPQRQAIRKYIQQTQSLETITRKKQQLFKIYEANTDEELYLAIYKQIREFIKYLNYLWSLQILLMQQMSYRTFSRFVSRALLKDHEVKDQAMILRMNINSDLRKVQHNNFMIRRAQVLGIWKLYEQDEIYHPFLMVQNFETPSQKYEITHEINNLVVFVHGYQGTDYDLEKAKNFLTIYSPGSYGLLIKSIQDEIDESIEHLGQKVAQEIKSHIAGSINSYKRISILGYSLGGVIARESIKHLLEYKNMMNLLVTFASPHLGVSENDNKLVGTGIWYLINFQKVKNLKQLNCQKNESQPQSQSITLQKLSNCQCLSWFRKFILVSSQEDNFVPYYSSRISCQDIKENILVKMAQQIQARANKIERVQVWFDVAHNINTFDKILGRRAHIQFLENRIFLNMFFRLYGSQF